MERYMYFRFHKVRTFEPWMEGVTVYLLQWRMFWVPGTSEHLIRNLVYSHISLRLIIIILHIIW